MKVYSPDLVIAAELAPKMLAARLTSTDIFFGSMNPRLPLTLGFQDCRMNPPESLFVTWGPLPKDYIRFNLPIFRTPQVQV